MTRECQVRICERLGVKFPGPTRRVSRASPVQTAMRNCTRDEGRSSEAGSQVLASNRCKLLSSERWPIACAMQHGVLLWVKSGVLSAGRMSAFASSGHCPSTASGKPSRLHSRPPPLLLCGRLTTLAVELGARDGSHRSAASQPGLSFPLAGRRLDKRRKRDQSWGLTAGANPPAH
jgi:hypothetical protein